MCGIVAIFGQPVTRAQPLLAQMLAAVQSRGETDEQFVAEGVCVATRRLKIVDRERAVQPIWNEDRSKAVIFNGEIFNWRVLRRALQGKHHFATGSDTETILHAYEEYGERCVEYLDGQFAFVIFDVQSGEVFAARDPFGIVPLYFVYHEGVLFVASTIGALTRLGRPIQVLPPGHLLDRGGAVRPYYRPEYRPASWSQGELTGKLRTALGEAVRKRVDTDLPIGVIYSGGIDSSIVLHEASRAHPDCTAYTIGAAGSQDIAVAQRFCAERGIRHVVIPLERRQLGWRSIRRAIRLTELNEYLDIINAVVSLPLFEAIHRSGVKVVLGGDGSDELFGGYDMYRQVAQADHGTLLLHNLMTLHRTELQRVDRSSMAFGVETRVPFLDLAVVELALQTPVAWKIQGLEKWPVREAYREELPSYIVERAKNPLSYSSGLHEWVRRYKPLFGHFYRQNRFALHRPLKMDFSYLLSRNGHDVARTVAEDQAGRDYSRLELLKEALKANVRTYVR